jgi:hypothetical protein
LATTTPAAVAVPVRPSNRSSDACASVFVPLPRFGAYSALILPARKTSHGAR